MGRNYHCGCDPARWRVRWEGKKANQFGQLRPNGAQRGKAGFNPLTALRNGSSAGFTTTVSHPGLSGLGDAIAQVGGQIGAAVSQKLDQSSKSVHRSKVRCSIISCSKFKAGRSVCRVSVMCRRRQGPLIRCKGLRLWRSPGASSRLRLSWRAMLPRLPSRFERSLRD